MKLSDLTEAFAKRTYASRLEQVGTKPGEKGKVYHYDYGKARVPFQAVQTFHIGGTLGGMRGAGKRSRVATGLGLVTSITHRIIKQLPELQPRNFRERHRLEQDIGAKVAKDLIEAGIITYDDLGYAFEEEF